MEYRFAGTMKKNNKQKLSGIIKHNKREYENNSNEDIDPSKTHLNYELIPTKTADEIIGYIEENKTSKRKTRKDAILVNEWVISDMALQDEYGDHVLDENGEKQYYLESLKPEEREKYFKVCTAYFMKRFGKENVTHAVVHNDEVNTHLHLGVVPLRDGKLSSKNVFDRKTLKQVQDELPRFLQSNGFDISRGLEGNKRVKYSDKDYKELQEEKKKLREEVQQERLKQQELQLQVAKQKEVIKKLSQITEDDINEAIDEAMTKRAVAINKHNVTQRTLKKVGLSTKRNYEKGQDQNLPTNTKNNSPDYPH